MCAENGEVILKVSHRPGEENQSNQNKTQTKKNKQTKQPGQDATQVGHAEQHERGETRGVKYSKTASQQKLCMSRLFKGQATVLRSVGVPLRTSCGACTGAGCPAFIHVCIIAFRRGFDNLAGSPLASVGGGQACIGKPLKKSNCAKKEGLELPTVLPADGDSFFCASLCEA